VLSFPYLETSDHPWRYSALRLLSAGIDGDIGQPAEHAALSSLLVSIVFCLNIESAVLILVGPDFLRLDNVCR
jgi:hypothetical protein